MANPWDKLPNEPDEAWLAFQHYRDAKTGRSLAKSYRAIYNQPNARGAPTFFRNWARDYDWEGRIAAWDNRLQTVKQASVERVIEAEAADWARRQEETRNEDWETADKLHKKALEMLNFPLSTEENETAREDGPNGETIIYKTIIHPAGWKVRDIPIMIKVASELRRLAAGMETEITRADLKVEIEHYLNLMRTEGKEIDIDVNEVIEIAESMAEAGKTKQEKD